MPANLPPQYFETEKKLKTAKTPQEKIAVLEELLAIVPKHKGTEKLQALLKTKIAKQKSLSQKKGGAARQTPIHFVEKAGAGQVVLIGPPNCGKSSLLKTLTNASPEIGNYPFTTRLPIPGMMPYRNIQIQLVDTPPVSKEFMESWQAELIKAADAVVAVLDLAQAEADRNLEVMLHKLEEKKIRLVPRGTPVPLEKQPFIKPAFFVGNKSDSPDAELVREVLLDSLAPDFDLLAVSSKQNLQLDTLRERIYDLLDILRVYSKIPGKKADFTDPFVFRKGSTLMDMAKAVHKDFAERLKFARIWGSDKYQGQKVNRDYVLQEEDIIELHL